MGAKAIEANDEIVTGGILMHSDQSKSDFSGYATKAGLVCTDGRTIGAHAFKQNDGATVPLVWQHGHTSPENVLGHVLLEDRKDGVYCYGYFNDSDSAKNAKRLVQHGDVKALSIYANQLVEKVKNVLHGAIREVSLVLAGANPGALIDNIELQHSDGEMVIIDDEAVIYTGLTIEHGNKSDDETKIEKTDDEDPTIQEVFDSFTEDQKKVVHYMVGAAHEEIGSAATHSDITEEEEGRRMTRNVFDQTKEKGKGQSLSHDDVKGIVADAIKGGSLKEAVEEYAVKHGIENIDVLFPDAKAISDTPDFDARRMEWVKAVINGTKHSPFSRIKSLIADLTLDEARAKGYVKGNLKKEEYFSLTKRVTTPATIYKKQKLDRDDILDITDLDVVAWLKTEMRFMLDEELARAVLIGDGRPVDHEDKIKDPIGATEGAGIRSVLHDHDLYAATVTVDSAALPADMVDAILENMRFYKGTGSPTLFTTLPMLTRLLLAKDSTGRRLYRTASDLASELTVSNIVAVEVMESETDLVGIVVNLNDYTIGSDKGGDVSFFDDFDIDYNQYKYLLETRLSGGLTKIRSALILKTAGAGTTLRTPVTPGFADNVITPATTTGVTYKRADTNATVTTGAPITLTAGQKLKIYAIPSSGASYFANNVEDEWTFVYEA